MKKLYCYHCWEDIDNMESVIVNQEMSSVFCCEECADDEIDERIRAFENDNVRYIENQQLKEVLINWGFTME